MRPAIKTFLTMFASLLVLSGCGKIDIKVQIAPDLKSLHLTEEITCLYSTQQLLGILQPPGSTDYWQTLQALCKKKSWNFRQKAANKIVIGIDQSTADLTPIETMLSNQLAATATAYGATVDDQNLLPVKISVESSANPFYTTYKGQCEYDWSIEKLEKKLNASAMWAAHVHEAKDGPINVVVTLPGDITSTNGKRKDSHTVEWTVRPGQKGVALLECRLTNWPMIGAVVALVLLVAGVTGAMLLKKRKNND
jgi:hypothetical protein